MPPFETQLPEALVAAVRSGNCVAFVGAGFSAAAGLPTWHALLDELSTLVAGPRREHVQRLLQSRSAHAMDEAAQILEDALTREGFASELRRRFASPPHAERMGDRLRWLQGIPFRAILTTNFDGLLNGLPRGTEAYSAVLRSTPSPWWKRVGDEGIAFETPIVKLHGDVRSPESIVFARQDYRALLYGNPGYREFLRTVLANYPVLYLGFSFTDAYLNELRSETLALLGYDGSQLPVAFAVVNDALPLTCEHFKRHEGVHVLSYDTDGKKDFTGFDRTLQALFEATNPSFHFGRLLARKRLLWVDPKPDGNQEVRRFFSAAKDVADVGLDTFELCEVRDASAALKALREARDQERPFDLVITHWGWAAEASGGSTAEALLRGMRSEDSRAPIVVFSLESEVETRKRTALGLGAQGYCFTYEGLLRTIERVLDPHMETN